MSICLMAFWLLGIVGAGGNSMDLPPSPFEAFATRPTSEIVWLKRIGRIEGSEARLTITALAIEDSKSSPSVQRGLRIDLAHSGPIPACDWKYHAWQVICKRPNAAIYVEEERLELVRDSIKVGAAELRPWEFIARYESRHSTHSSSGLIVGGYQFSDRQPSELAALFTRAIEELKVASR